MPTLLLLALAALPDSKDVDAVLPGVDAIYRSLHQAPELSNHEEKTSEVLAKELEAMGGVTVTRHVGGFGIVGVIANGSGPVVLVRTDMDGLPVEEKTGLDYASKTPGVMHACGHDMHMAVWLGTARVLLKERAHWKGTVLLVGQPAEEMVTGAKGMVAAGLFEKFPKPNFGVALHNQAQTPAGKVGVGAGFALANVDTVALTLYGRGGHGASPHLTVDPIVMAAKVVLSLQTLVSRENSPLEPAVITVGSIHGGTKSNIIPDEVKLQLTVRSYKPEVRAALLEGIGRIAKAEAEAARAPRPPEMKLEEGANAVVNDEALARRISAALTARLGADNVLPAERVMGSEDFGEFGAAGHFPSAFVWLGAVAPDRYAAAKAKGEPLPTLHSALFAPDRERELRTGVTALTAMTLELLGK